MTGQLAISLVAAVLVAAASGISVRYREIPAGRLDDTTIVREAVLTVRGLPGYGTIVDLDIAGRPAGQWAVADDGPLRLCSWIFGEPPVRPMNVRVTALDGSRVVTETRSLRTRATDFATCPVRFHLPAG